MLNIIFALIPMSLAQTGFPNPSADVVLFQRQIQQQVKDIHAMGPLCAGGGRKWARIYSLRLRIRESEVVTRMDSRLETLPPSCRAVVYTGDRFDYSGNVLVIPQRIVRSREMNATAKAECLQYWADWGRIEAVYDDVSPILGEWDDECVRPNSPPASPALQGSGGAIR